MENLHSPYDTKYFQLTQMSSQAVCRICVVYTEHVHPGDRNKKLLITYRITF